MKIYKLKYKQIIKKRTIQEVFDFFSRPENLSIITPTRLNFTILDRALNVGMRENADFLHNEFF